MDGVSLSESVAGSLAGLAEDPRDAAARDLAILYAAKIDETPGALFDLGPKLLASLDALGLTPRSRSAGGKTPDTGPVRNPLDELRDRRAARGQA
jgi:hypothetical protein